METTQPATKPSINASRRKKIALLLLIVPSVLIVMSIGLFAIMNLVFNPTMWPTPDTEAYAATPLSITITNVILYITGVVGMVAWLPGLIIGVVLLVKKSR